MRIEIKEKYKVVSSEEGYVLTNYKEGMDIKSYNSFTECICPLSCNLEHLSEVSIDKDAEYKELAIKASKEYYESIKVR